MKFPHLLPLAMTLVLSTNAQLLNCNFDDNTTCNWVNALNGLEDDFDWKIGNNLMVDGWHSIPRTLTGTGNFAYVQGQFRPSESEAARAWLRSPVIDGLGAQTVLSFNYWKTAAPPTLQVCTRDAGESILKCFETISGIGPQSWSKRTVVIPPNPVPFQIIIAASGFRTGLDTLAIDDITYSQVVSKNATPLRGVSQIQAKPAQKLFGLQYDQYKSYRLGTTGFRANGLGAGSGGFQSSRIDSGPNRFLPEHSAFSSFNSGFGNNFPNNNSNSLSATVPTLQQNANFNNLNDRVRSNLNANGANLNNNFASNSDQTRSNSITNGANLNGNFQSTSDQTRSNWNGNIDQIRSNSNINGASLNGNLASITDQFRSTNNLSPIGAVNTDINRNFGNQNSPDWTPTVVRNFFTQPTVAQAATVPPVSISQFAVNSGNSPINPAQFVNNGNQQFQPAIQTDSNRQNSQGSCAPANCNFDTDMCDYYSTDFKSTTEWKLRNPLTPGFGIPTDNTGRNSYVYVSGDNQKNDQRALLGSGPFVIPNGAFLQFLAYISDPNTGRLSLYRNDALNPNNIIWQTQGSRALGPGWQTVKAPLKASTIPISVIFLADSLPGNQYIGVDDIRLTDGNDRDISCASLFDYTKLERNGKPFVEDLGPPKSSFGNFESSQQQSRFFTPPDTQVFPQPPRFAPQSVLFEPSESFQSNLNLNPNLVGLQPLTAEENSVENVTQSSEQHSTERQLFDFPPPPVSRTDPFLAALNGLISPVQPGLFAPQSNGFANSFVGQQQQQQQMPMDQFWGNLMKIFIGKRRKKK